MASTKTNRETLDDYWNDNLQEDYSKMEPQQGVTTVKHAVAWVQAKNIQIIGVEPTDADLESRLVLAGFNREDKNKRDVMDESIMLIIKWGWEGTKKANTQAMDIEDM